MTLSLSFRPPNQDIQVIPSAGPAREALREKGQFWTPAWLARVMAAWVVQEDPPALFDPAVGPGTFFAAAREVGFRGRFAGFEVDAAILGHSRMLGLASSELSQVMIGDFIGSRITCALPAVISNPPYIRHHRLSEARKNELRALAIECLGFALDGRVGLHFYFLLSRQVPGSRARWLRILKPDAEAILTALGDEPREEETNGSIVTRSRDLKELLDTGMSRPPRPRGSAGTPLSQLARVVRGIATGANEFFFLTRAQVRQLGLADRNFQRAVGRTRDRTVDRSTPAHLNQLDDSARPTWLLCLGKEPKEHLPDAMRAYLEHGERLGLPERPLIQTRRPWYRMEHRTPPPLLFAYLGRRDCRFILNRAGIVPLTCFLSSKQLALLDPPAGPSPTLPQPAANRTRGKSPVRLRGKR